MNHKFIGPENLPENDTIDLGAADEAAIRSAANSWRKSLRAHTDGEAAWDAAVGAALRELATGTDSVGYLPLDHPHAEEGNDETSRMYAAFSLVNVIIDVRQVRDTDTESRALAYLDTPGQLANEHRDGFKAMLGQL